MIYIWHAITCHNKIEFVPTVNLAFDLIIMSLFLQDYEVYFEPFPFY